MSRRGRWRGCRFIDRDEGLRRQSASYRRSQSHGYHDESEEWIRMAELYYIHVADTTACL